MQTRSWTLVLLTVHAAWLLPQAKAEAPVYTLTSDFSREVRRVEPRTGFLGGLRDTTPNAIIQPLHPSLWRIGHQFRGRIAMGLPGAIDRVQRHGATCKLVMGDLVEDKAKDYSTYELAVMKLVTQVSSQSHLIT